MAISTVATQTITLQSSIPYRTSSISTKTSSFSSSNSSFFTNTFKPLTLPTHGNRSSQLKNKKSAFSCTCLFGLGVPELVVIAGVVALVFGPKKLPEVGRSIGKTVKSFQQAAKEFETELKKDPETLGESSDITNVSEKEPEDLKVPSTKDSL
ncbi:sec-independent protein translocase protein TATA, chloroplastic-like [Rutidosis leptorrhynchoides]|uniref:sec-independent protein translocase protein TATA, chloroplastic-like n=1 Tax=Rutidosis leptorrhynchoides TaxID=125765 RepID=UPI003A993C30